MTVRKKKAPKKKATKKKKAAVNTPEKYIFGCPTKYKREYCDLVYQACKSGECLTIASICVMLEISRDTYYEWCSKYNDFSCAIKRGAEFRLNYMEQRGLKGMGMGKQFNAIPWLFLLKNMFPNLYSDKKEIELGNKEDKEFKFAFNLNDEPEE